MEGKKYLIIIEGPTASGKTSLAVSVAERLGTEIISADSRQVYREMKIGTAAPEPSLLARVRHHLTGHRSVKDGYNASIFENEALAVIGKLHESNDAAVMAGGSGLYIDAVCRGIDDLPSISHEVRAKMKRLYAEGSLEVLKEKLRQTDETYFNRVDLSNPSRIIKALEVFEMTGRPYSSFLTGKDKQRDFIPVRIGLDTDRKVLYGNINSRVDRMMGAGLLEEARSLYPLKGLDSLNTVGYRELFMYFGNEITLDEAVELIKAHTRQYARRQLTWFRKDKEIKWFDAGASHAIFEYIDKIMNSDGDPRNKAI